MTSCCAGKERISNSTAHPYISSIGSEMSIPVIPKKVCLIGSGNWGSAVAWLIGQNTEQNPQFFHTEVPMYVYEETIEHNGEQRKLSEVINEENENVKYLPGIKLPKCIKAVPDLKTAAKDADMLIWVVPHQFVTRMTGAVREVMSPDAASISLIKGGIDIKDGEIELCSDVLKRELAHPTLVLMGANLANEVARGDFCEATIGFDSGSTGLATLTSTYSAPEAAQHFQKLFTTPSFSVNTIDDVAGVELCGALKNIIALGAGFVDGMGMGSNTKAAAIRIGLQEMVRFVKLFYPKGSKSETFFESCGVADLITTCFGGRNRKCAEAFIKRRLEKKDDMEVEGKGHEKSSKDLWTSIEAEMLNGQKLQGTLTCEEIVSVLEKHDKTEQFPMIMNIHGIAFQGKSHTQLFEGI